MMTEAATEFVRPLTFEALSQKPVYTRMFPDSGDPEIQHVHLAGWPDLILVAPATANLIGKCALGLGDDLASATLLAAQAPVLWAPAMESHITRLLPRSEVCGGADVSVILSSSVVQY